MAWEIRPSRHGVTETFYEIYPTYEAFKADYLEQYPELPITLDNLQILYNLLYAKHGTDEILNMTQMQFKYRLFGTVFQYGPAWETRLKIQAKVRALVDNDELLREGSKAVHNHAFNPSTDPSTASLSELEYINDQNTTNYKKSKIDAYSDAWALVVSDVTEQFLDRFDKLFKTFVNPFGYGYVQEDENE